MGIPLSKLTEGCCDTLESIESIDMDEKKDKYDGSMASCDKVVECETHFMYIEEKSFLLDFFNKVQKEHHCTFHIEDEEITDKFLDFLHEISRENKAMHLALCLVDKMNSSAKKIKDTTLMLSEDDSIDSTKLKKVPIVYLYCESGLEIDRLFSLILSRYIKNNEVIVLDCNKLEKFLKKQCV